MNALSAYDDRRVARVLVVDDDPQGADALAELVGLLGHETASVYDGESAVRAAADRPFDLALVDLRLPGIDGFEVARQLKASARRRLVVVAVTASADDADVARARAAGFDDYVTKPVDTSKLVRHLRT